MEKCYSKLEPHTIHPWPVTAEAADASFADGIMEYSKFRKKTAKAE